MLILPNMSVDEIISTLAVRLLNSEYAQPQEKSNLKKTESSFSYHENVEINAFKIKNYIELPNPEELQKSVKNGLYVIEHKKIAEKMIDLDKQLHQQDSD